MRYIKATTNFIIFIQIFNFNFSYVNFMLGFHPIYHDTLNF